MKAILIDDEKAMHLIMSRLLVKLPGIEVVGKFQDTASAEAYLDGHPVDMIFVDIQMPKETGMRFAERMAELRPELHIVFVTSHKDYALEAFDLLALDYIVKPISLERLEKTVRRALAMHRYALTEQSEEARSGVSIYGLGGLEVRSADGRGVKWRSRKSAELFGYLLVHRGRMISRTRLIDDVFDGMPQRNAEVYLNTAVYQLRKSLEPLGLKSLITSDNDHYGLDIPDAYIDYVEIGEKMKGFDVIDATNLEQAIEVEMQYTGDLFGERGYLWALHEVERYSEQYIAFAKRLIAALTQRDEGDPTALRLLQKLHARNELDEDVVSLLLRVHATRQDQTAFQALYTEHVRTLRKELRIEPSMEIAALYQSLSDKL